MAANEDPKDIATTDKAYQAAVEAASDKSTGAPGKAAKVVKPEVVKPKPKPKAAAIKTVAKERKAQAPVPKVSTPAATAAPKPSVAAAEARPVPVDPVEAKPAVAKPADKPEIERPQAVKAAAEVKPPVEVKPVEKVVPVKVAAPEPAVEAARNKPVIPAAPSAAATPKAAKTASQPAFVGLFTNFMLEDTKMNMSTNFSGFQDVMGDAQTKAKEVFEKSTKVFGEVGDFTKGNVEAVIESGKILADGVQSLGSELVAEGRSAFETFTGDIKELAAAKSPTDFFKIQSDVMRKNFDSAVAYGSKNSEAMLKLVSDVMAPISGRVSLAMEKARSTSL